MKKLIYSYLTLSLLFLHQSFAKDVNMMMPLEENKKTGQESRKNMDVANQEILIYNFENPSQIKHWRPINDTVMGGVSNSSVAIIDKNTLHFHGNVSLDNNGGFASMRTYGPIFNLKEYEGIIFRVKGDGKRFYFNLRNTFEWRTPNFRMAFETTKNEWITVKIPFDKLKAVVFGRPYSRNISFDSSNIVSMGVLIADKQVGSFEMKIDWIKAYK